MSVFSRRHTQVCVILAFTLNTGIYKCEYNLMYHKTNFRVRKLIIYNEKTSEVISLPFSLTVTPYIFTVPSGEFSVCDFTHLSVKQDFQSQHSHLRIKLGFLVLPERDLVSRIGPADREIILTLFLVECVKENVHFFLICTYFQRQEEGKKKKNRNSFQTANWKSI